LEACRRNRPRAMRRVQLRGGARRQPARRTFCTLSRLSRAPYLRRWALLIALERHAEYFLQRRAAEERLGEAVLEHGLHARRDGGLADDRAVAPLHDHPADVVVDLEHLEDPHAPAESRARALRTALPAKQAHAAGEVVGDAQDALT